MTTELETKPPVADPGQAAPDAPANPPQDAGATGQQPPAGAPASVSREEFETLRKQNEDILRGMNAAQRDAADLRAERDLYQRQAQAAAGVLPARDPEAAAWDRFQSSGSFDDLKTYQDLREQRLAQNIRASVLSEQRLMSSMPVARDMLGVADDAAAARQLQGVHQTLTPEELAVVHLRRQGKLNDWIAEEQKAKERRAREAGLSGPAGFGSPGRSVPGMPGNGKEIVEFPFTEWAQLTPEAKARFRSDPKTDFVVTGAPRHFDPNKD